MNSHSIILVVLAIACLSSYANCMQESHQERCLSICTKNSGAMKKMLTQDPNSCPSYCKKVGDKMVCDIQERKPSEPKGSCHCNKLASGGAKCKFQVAKANRRLCPVSCHKDSQGIKFCTMFSRRLSAVHKCMCNKK